MSAALIFFQRKGVVSVHWHVVAGIISIGGTLFLADIFYWHPDAQGAISVLMVPMLQGIVFSLYFAVAWSVSRRART